jgi:hypothetical protein
MAMRGIYVARNHNGVLIATSKNRNEIEKEMFEYEYQTNNKTTLSIEIKPKHIIDDGE